MINIEYQKERFKDHIATFTDLGNVKILDFKRPDSFEYRIRFLFEEDYYKLHISGDLGELIASNYKNMCYKHFNDFVHNTGYFEEKIDCHNRPIYTYDEEQARKDLIEIFDENEIEILPYNNRYYSCETEEAARDELISDMLNDFDYARGFGSKAYDLLSEIDSNCWDYIGRMGKQETGILDLYMLAFELAQKQLADKETENEQ